MCPHQDYIWAVDVSSTEKEKIKEYDERVSKLCDTLFGAENFDNIVLLHPWLSEECSETEVIKNPELAIALLTFIKQKQHPLPQDLLNTLDLAVNDIPV